MAESTEYLPASSDVVVRLGSIKYMNNSQSELINFFFKTKNSKFKTCLAPKEKCNQEAIRAHTVQNSKPLDLLVSNDNHVIAIRLIFSGKKPPVFNYEKVSRNEATTFTGLCSTHDTEIFKPIDTQKIDASNPEQCFLLAYRAVMKELHSSMEAAKNYQEAYYKLEEPNKYPNNPLGLSGVQATKGLINSYEIYQYKFKYDFIYEYKSYEYINHCPIILNNQKPTIAVSSMFSVNNMKNNDNEPFRIVLNILPLSSNKTIVIFSCLSHENTTMKTKLNHIFTSNEHLQKYEISKLILRYCENFVIASEYFDSWSEKKKKLVQRYFEKNMISEWEFEHPEIMLF